MSANPASPSAPPGLNEAQRARLISPLVLWPLTVLLAVLLFFGLDSVVTALTHETTDDAFIEGHVISIAPKISGRVAAVHALDNQLVHSNDLLVEIDPADYAMAVAQKRSAAESQSANYETVVSAYELMKAKVVTAEASARKAQADADASDATAKRAESDFARQKELRDKNTISQQEFDDAQADYKTAQADYKSAVENASEEQSKITEAHAQLAAAAVGVKMALAQWNEARTNVAAAELDLSYVQIFAPTDGRITRKSVESGNYLQIGQTLMAIVPTEVWVVANFKESQLKDIRVGQPVRVKIDALGRTFKAHVDSLQAGTGARFSLFPPENATGNYVKVVQRVPVKIIFDDALPADSTIGPGMSVVPSVRTSAFAVPDWAIGIIAVVLALVLAAGFRLVLGRKKSSPAAA